MQEPNAAPAKTPRWIKIALGVSLALNLAVVGMIAGAAVRQGDGGGGPRSSGFGAYGLPYMIALPRAERRAVVRAIKSDQQAGLPDRAARRALYQEVLAALRAEPFDAGALTQALGQQTETTIAVQKVAQGAWLEVVSGMTHAERTAYAADVEAVLKRGPKPRK